MPKLVVYRFHDNKALRCHTGLADIIDTPQNTELGRTRSPDKDLAFAVSQLGVCAVEAALNGDAA